jgi:hypothetical protein
MSDPNQFLVKGDLQVEAGLDPTNHGDGFLYVTSSSGGLDVEGLTTLDQTTINTTDGKFHVIGTNKVEIAPTGGSGSIEMTGAAASFLKTSAGNLQIDSEVGILDLDGASMTLNSDTGTIAAVGATGVSVTSTANNIVVNAAATVDIDGGTSILVDSAGTISLDANATSNFTVAGGGNLQASSVNGRVIVDGGGSASNAVTIISSNAAGGVDIDAGTAGFDVLATGGPFSIDGQHASSNITLTTNADAQDFTIGLTGVSNSSIIVTSSGTGTDAVKITAAATAGGIDIDAGTAGIVADTTGGISLDSLAASNFTVTGAADLTLSTTAGSAIITAGEAAVDAVQITASNIAGGVDVNAGTGGITVDTTAGFSIDGADDSNVTVTGAADLTIETTGGSAIITAGEAVADAIQITSSNAAGGIDVNGGTGGITVDSTGAISLDAAAASNFSIATTGAAQDLTLSVTGATDSSVIVSSSGTGADAIKVNATAGGIDIDATGVINIDTTNTATGISIATATAGVPITIGSSTSVTTIPGDLLVTGTRTFLNTETTVIEDNIIILNSGNGELGADGGMVIRRFQTPNGTGAGDVVTDTAAQTGAFQAGSATPATVVLATGANATNDFYNGWWIKVTSGTGVNQVRRIEDYVGATRTATLYQTSDNTVDFLDGLDLAAAPAAADTYSLYNAGYSAVYYDESDDTFTIAATALTPDAVPTAGISTVTVTKYLGLNVGGPVTIHDNGVPANSILNVNFIEPVAPTDEVCINGLCIGPGGVITGGNAPLSEVVTLVDNSQAYVNITNSTTTGLWFVLVEACTTIAGTVKLTTGAFAMFACANSDATDDGTTTRLVASKGTDNQNLDARWAAGNKIQLRHRPAWSGGSGANVFYKVSISSTFIA